MPSIIIRALCICVILCGSRRWRRPVRLRRHPIGHRQGRREAPRVARVSHLADTPSGGQLVDALGGRRRSPPGPDPRGLLRRERRPVSALLGENVHFDLAGLM